MYANLLIFTVSSNILVIICIGNYKYEQQRAIQTAVKKQISHIFCIIELHLPKNIYICKIHLF